MKKVKKSTLKLIIGFEVVLFLLVVTGLIMTFFYVQQVSTAMPTVISTPHLTATPTIFFASDSTTTVSIDNFPSETSIPLSIEQPLDIETVKYDYLVLSEASIIPPDDILHEVSYFVGGGGWSECPPTENIYINIPKELNWPAPLSFQSCGWVDDEIILTIQKPSGNIETKILPVWLNGVDYSEEASLEMEMGRYVFMLSGGKDTIEGTVNIVLPSRPTMYSLMDGSELLILSGFRPGEKIRLFGYVKISDAPDYRMKLVGWNEFQAGASGNLVVENAVGGYKYAIGEYSGFIGDNAYQSNPLTNYSDSIEMPYCGGLKSQLNTGITARVAFINGIKLNIHDQPSFISNVINQVSEGTEIYLLDRYCSENSTWWRVRLADKSYGWMAEEQNGGYLLEPLP